MEESSSIKPISKPTDIDDEIDNNTSFTSDKATDIINLLKSGNYQSNQLDSIFFSLIQLDGVNHLKQINEFSKQEQYKKHIMTAIRKYINENDVDYRIYQICTILNNYKLSEQDQPLIEKISQSILSNLDSIEILPLFKNFKFLVINDLDFFVDVSPHNSLFYTILKDRDLPKSNELTNELISFDNENEDVFYCTAFHDFLLKAYNDVKDEKFLFKLLEITKFSSDEDEYSNDEIAQSLNLFYQFLQNSENKESVKSIIQILQERNTRNNYNFNLKNFLIRISDIKDLLHFSNSDEIDSIVSSLSLNDDSLAFIASIGGTINEGQLTTLFNSSDNFYPKYIVASLFPSVLEKLSNEQKMNCYNFGCKTKHYKLCNSIIQSILPILHQEEAIFNECIYNTSSSIAALTLSSLQDSTPGIFNDPAQVKTIITNLYESKTQDNFDLPFSAYLNRLKQNDQDMCTAVWNVFFDSQFPPFYRTDANTCELFKLLSTSTSTFIELIENVSIQPYSLYRPTVSLNYVQMFSNIPSVFLEVEQKSYLLYLYKLLFGYSDSLNSSFQDKSISDFIKMLKVSEKLFESVWFSFADQQLMSDSLDPIHPISPKVSVSQSLFNDNKFFAMTQTPSVLIIRIEGKVTPDFIIDEQLDLSSYCLYTAYYELRSVGCDSNIAFLKQAGKNKYLKCTKNIVTSVDKIDSCNINFIIYEKVKSFTHDSFNKALYQFWHDKKSNIKQILDSNQAIMRCLHSDFIDWTLFEQTDKFCNVAIKLIQLGVKKVFKALSSSPNFSSLFFDEYYSLFENESIIAKFRDEIMNLANIYDSDPPTLFLNLTECLNSKNIALFFDLFDKFDIMKNNIDNRIGIIQSIPDSLLNTSQFEKFFIDTINMSQCNDELINYVILERKKLIPLILKVSRQKYFHLYSHLIDKDQFESIVNEFEPQFIIYALEHCTGKRSVFLPIALNKIKNTSEWKDYINRVKDNLTIDDIKSIYEARDFELATEILEFKYPFKTTLKQDEVKDMFIKILSNTRSSNLYLSLRNVIRKYYSIFNGDPKITELLAAFTFTLQKKNIQDYVEDLTSLIDILPPVRWNKVIEIYTGQFPLRRADLGMFFTQLNADKMSLFMLHILSRSIQSYDGFVYENMKFNDYITIILSSLCPFIVNKKEFANIIVSTFRKFIDNHKIFARYLDDLKVFPYIVLKLLELTVDTGYWKSDYTFIFIKMILETIKTLYSQGSFYGACFYFDDANENIQRSLSSYDKCSIALLRLAYTNLEKNYLDPNVTDITFSNNILILNLLTDLDSIHIEKLSDNVKLEFFKFFKIISYIYPLFLDQVVKYIIQTKRKVNMYQRIANKETHKAYTDLVCNLFREMIGDLQYIQSPNDDRFKTAMVLLKSQFMCLLLTKNFTFQQFQPYYFIFMAFFKLKNADVFKAFANCLKQFPFVLYLLYTKDIKVGAVDNSSKINLFLTNFYLKIGEIDDPYPQIVIEFIKFLKVNDPQMNEIVNILIFLFKGKFLEKQKPIITRYCFNEIEQIALQRTDILKIKDLLDSAIILMGL